MANVRFVRGAAALTIGLFSLVACAANGAGGDDENEEAARSGEVNLANVPSLAAAAKGPDLDQDGIADELEEQLLRRYRPFYKFSTDGDKVEANGPADPVTEIAHAQLKMMQGDDDVSGVVAGCGEKGDYHLVPASSLLTCKPDTTFANSDKVGSYCLNIDNSRYGGVPITQAKTDATGLFGHVTRGQVNGGHLAYVLEYWQFYAFNNQDITILGMGSFGDHEGDWTGVQLWVDSTTGQIGKLLYMVHGHDITFDVPAGTAPACASCMQAVKGSHYDPNVGSFFDATENPKYNDNQAEFWLDENKVEHVVLYIERGGHETWPGAWGTASFSVGPVSLHLDSHNGAGESYLVPDAPGRPWNLGEVDHPLGDDATLLVQYNGHVGCTNAKDLFGLAPQRRSPVMPSAHCEWKYPNGGKSPPGCEH